jgi:3-methyladenine DNA glycosylase AlkD
VKPAREVEQRLRQYADAAVAEHAHGFFHAEPGGYGEGDRFLGVRVPDIRKVARDFRGLDAERHGELLESPWHEVRLLALIVMVWRYERAEPEEQETLYRLYLQRTAHIDNWDLVDSSAPGIVGAHLEQRDRQPLFTLARSTDLWERRIAMVATHWLIKRDDVADTFRLAELLLGDRHDLIHKAAGWMLREAGERQPKALYGFLDEHAARMPRTMLRYALEKVPAARRQRYMKQKV